MKLVIDMQLLQTPDADRGMGKYLKGLLTALSAHWRKSSIEYEIVAITNSELPQAEQAGSFIVDLFPGAIVRTLHLAHKRNDIQTFKKYKNKNKSIVDKELSLIIPRDEEYLFFIPSQFSNDIFPVFPDYGKVIKALLFYDLIPYLFSSKYFSSYSSPSCIDYCERFSSLYESDTILSISQTTSDDLGIYLGFDQSRLGLILGSGADRVKAVATKPMHITVPDRYVLMPSGDDIRKNNVRGVQAFAESRRSIRDDIKLLITSNISSGTKSELLKISPDIIFTGSVSDGEYEWLMKNAECVFFPTEYEGLGMPVLEAVNCNVPIVCSSIAVFREIHPAAFKFFNPRSVSSISMALSSQLREKSVPDKDMYEEIRRRFTWDNTALLFSNVMKTAVKEFTKEDKPKLAIFTPRVDSYSAIGKYALETHAELCKKYQIDYFFESGQTSFSPTRLDLLSHIANSYPASSFKNPDAYSEILSHIGNSEFHINTILNCYRYSTSILLHDCRLRGIFEYMSRNHQVSAERYIAEKIVSEEYGHADSSFTFTLVDKSKRVLCHSDYVQNTVKSMNQVQSNTMVISHPIATPEIHYQNDDSSKTTIAFAGIISPEKGLSLIEEISLTPGVKVKLFGYSVLGHDKYLNELENVEILRDLTDLEFQEALRNTDILINYREIYNGETSRTAIEAMRYGVNVIVKDIGWFGELPKGVVHKVKNTHELVNVLQSVLLDEGLRDRVSEEARKYTSKELGFSKYAKSFKSRLGGQRNE